MGGMETFWQRHWFKVVAAVVLIAVAGTVLYNTGGMGGKLPIIQKAADFELESSDGKTVKFSDGTGKVRLVYFFWSNCPDVCQPTTYELSKVQQELKQNGLFGKDAMIYSISFDPQRDTVEQLKKYSARFQADSAGWVFLRGEEQAIKELAKQYAVSVIKGSDGTFMHTNSVALVDREGNVRKYFVAKEANLDYKEVVKEVVRLSKEKQK